MRKHILTAVALLPLLINLAHAAQRWTIESAEPFGIPSEDSGTSSYLGVDIVDVSTDRLGALKLKEEQGVEITMVDQDAPAGKAGLKEHDVILTMNGTAIESKTQLQRMIHETPPGRVVTLGLSRDGQALTIKVQLADRRNEFHMAWKNKSKDKDKDKDFSFEMAPIPPIPPMPNVQFDMPNIDIVVVHSSVRSGLMVENLTPQLGDFFGAKNGNGVLVRSVEKGSRADKAGLRAGDVINRVGDQPVHDTSDFTHALRSRSAGSVSVGVIRDKKEQTITLSLPDTRESGGVIEESLEAPEVDSQTRIELTEVQDEIAKLRPQIDLVKGEFTKSFRDLQEQMKERAEKMKREFTPQLQQEFEKGRQEMERLRLQMQSGSLDL